MEKINIYISTQEAPLTFESIDLKELLQMVREEFSTQLSIRQIKWSVPEVLSEIHADRLSMLRVFRNLVDNALKYGGERLKEIHIGYKKDHAYHVLSVRDDGRGLQEKDSKKIFGLFKREASSRGIQGTGLGLAIVKEIAQQHGGDVWLDAAAKKGTTFYFSISKDL